jgi:hypothetical protein
MRYLGVALMTALLMNLIGYGWFRYSRAGLTEGPVAPPTNAPSEQASGQKLDPEHPNRESGREVNEALTAITGAWRQGAEANAEPAKIPTLDSPPPLQQLMLESDSRDVQNAAREVRSWLNTTAGAAMGPCWRRTPDPPVWVEIAGDLSRQGDQLLGVSNVRMVRVRGEYQPSAEEQRCFIENLSAIGARPTAKKVMAALERHLPVTESVLMEWPCGACRER